MQRYCGARGLCVSRGACVPVSAVILNVFLKGRRRRGRDCSRFWYLSFTKQNTNSSKFLTSFPVVVSFLNASYSAGVEFYAQPYGNERIKQANPVQLKVERTWYYRNQQFKCFNYSCSDYYYSILKYETASERVPN